jgi:8-oxo-dGTP pyrophosphatase MutT (NUDIX family)
MNQQQSPNPAATPAVTPRDAATLILARRDQGGPRVLMGMRGAKASFMPSKFVFPGGALDPDDGWLTDAPALSPACVARLEKAAAPGLAMPLALAAIRETFEETGVALGRPDPLMAERAAEAPESWREFLNRGLIPATDRLTFIFRAVTPPYRPKRFDARFFLATADEAVGDLDDFSGACGELSHLSWLTLDEARGLELPLITEVVLAEVAEILAGDGADRPAPYFHHDTDQSWFDAL